MDGLCPHGRPWDDCYEDGGHPMFPSGDGTGIDGPLGHPNLAFCKCGSAWFTTRVAIEQDGRVSSYMHPLTCVECGDQKEPGFRGDHPFQFTTEEWREEHGQ